MDYDMRITKLETVVESLQADFAELRRLIIDKIDGLRDNIDDKLAERDAAIESQFSEIRATLTNMATQASTEKQFAELRATMATMATQASTEKQFAELRATMATMATQESTERQFAEIRANMAALATSTEKQFAEIRASMDRGFAECRAEARASSRWRWGMLITTTLAIAGWVASAMDQLGG